MKQMNCKQLAGTCEKEFSVNTFEEMAELSKVHGIEMFKKQDKVHLEAMHKTQELMKKPEVIAEWLENKRKEFEALPEI